jgi:hypothetical protein
MRFFFFRLAPGIRRPVPAGVFLLAALPLFFLPEQNAFAVKNHDAVPVPTKFFNAGVSPASDPDRVMEGFLGLPYREDGAINENGEYTLFSDQGRRFLSPGLNCSGLVLESSRLLLGKNVTLHDAMRDRLGDSGPGASSGEDWDFGWDLILNISEGFSRRFLLPGGIAAEPSLGTGMSPRGYDIRQDATWKELPERLTPGHFYLVSLNVEGRRAGYGLQHYHVGCIHIASTGEAWFYQTTGKSGGVNRRDLKSRQGRASFRKAFADTGGVSKKMLVLEVDLP